MTRVLSFAFAAIVLSAVVAFLCAVETAPSLYAAAASASSLAS